MHYPIYGGFVDPFSVFRPRLYWGKMKKFNIRKVLDGLAASSFSSAAPQPGTSQNDVIQETLQSEHFQLCKVG